MKAIFESAAPYADDEMNLPVKSVADALPFYETVMGFQVVERFDSPHTTAILQRDEVHIGLVENGGDPEQEGCFFEVDNVETAFAELQSNGLQIGANFRLDRHGDTTYKVFFVIAPDGLCFCLGERQN